MYIRGDSNAAFGDTGGFPGGLALFARKAAGTVPTAVWAHGTSELARSDAEKFMNRIFGSLAPSNVALFEGLDVQLHIIPYDKRLTDLPEFASLKGTKTFDGRNYDDVRGMGGMKFGESILYAAGEDTLVARPGKPFYPGGRVVYHESGHVVGRFGLTRSQQDRLKDAFDKRTKANGPWLETYASSNPEEYLACATSAFFMNPPVGRTEDPIPYTREWLRRNDHPIHALLTDVYKGAGG